MPTYGYRCEKCGNTFEVSQRMTDEAAADCPACGAAARRLFYPTGIVFKGSGFYATDSRKSTASTPSSGSSTSSATSGDSKPAKKDSDTTASPSPSTSTAPSESTS